MDILQLLGVAYGGSKEERTEATTQLKTALESPDGPQHLLTLLRAGMDPALPAMQSLSALICAKNYIMEMLDDKHIAASPGVLEELKSLLYNGALQVPLTHQKIIYPCVSCIISSFQWNYLPQLMPEITRERTEVPVEQALSSLRLLYVFAKRFKTPGLEPMHMRLMVCNCLISALPSFLSYGNMEVDHVVLKLMECVVETLLEGAKGKGSIPAEALDPWFYEMTQYPERHFVAASEAGAAGNDSDKVYKTYVLCLKRIALISFSALHNATCKKDPSPVARRFLANYASTFFGVWQRWLEYAVTSQSSSDHHKVDMFAIRYIKMCSLDETLYRQYLLPQLMHMIEFVLFPFLCFNAEDESVFCDDGDISDFVQYMVEEGFEQSEVSKRQAAANAILAIAKGKKHFHEDSLQKVIDFLKTGLSKEDNNETFHRTFGFLHLLSVLRKYLKHIPEIWQTQMTQILVTFVAPRVLPTVPFIPIRCKALVVCQRYSKAPIPLEEDFAAFTQLVCSLVNDADARIRLSAIDAICTFLEMKRALPYIRPILLPLMEECIGFLDRVQAAFVPTVILYLVKHFAPELASLLDKIASTLVKHFFAISFDIALEEDNPITKEGLLQYSCKDMSADALLDALDTIVEGSYFHMEVFCKMRPDLLLLVRKVLETPDNYAFIEKTLPILLNVVNYSKPLTPECWEILPLLLLSVESGIGVDFFVGIEEVLDSFISNGTVQYMQNPQIMDITYQICEKILFHCVTDVSDQIAVPQLIEAMLHQAKHCQTVPGLFDTHLSRFVLLLLRALAENSSNQGNVRLQVWIIAALMDAFYYNAAATLQIMVTHNAYPQFFDALFLFFRGAINPQGASKVPKKQKKRKGDNSMEAVESLSILTRKVIVLGLTALLEQISANTTESGSNNNNNNGTVDLISFEAYVSPTLALIQHCIFANDVLLASRCRITENNLEKIRQGVDVEEVSDVDLDDEDLLGVDVDDVVLEDDDCSDDDFDDLGGGGGGNAAWGNDGGDDGEVGRCHDEGDNYESPIDDVCEVTLFLQWCAKAVCLGDGVLGALSRSLQEFRAAETTALRYRHLVKELDRAMEEESKSRVIAPAAS